MAIVRKLSRIFGNDEIERLDESYFTVNDAINPQFSLTLTGQS